MIGKFYPLHLGHVGLIRRAAAACDDLTVVVMATQLESLSLAIRVGWVSESTDDLPGVRVIGVMDDAPVNYVSEIAWTAHVEVLLAALRNAGRPRPDTVFSSEPYGAELAERLGATAVTDDPSREAVRVSGTAVRQDPAATWHFLPGPVRRDLATRIIVVGAESTGTTTLADQLVEHYRERFPAIRPVAEYGREFTYELFERAAAAAREMGAPVPALDDLVWEGSHFGQIAREQTIREEAAAQAAPLVVADTDAFATSLWERRYVGEASREATRAATVDLPRRDLYLVTDHVGVPFEQDGWRDGEHIRATMTGWFVDGLTAQDLPWVLLRGQPQARLAYAVQVIDALVAQRTGWRSPEWADRTILL
ncbi:hypothetical protein GCM10025867_34650 [Frondihabitans sucicola]|uniref:NadR/Ttd14 AAA domain-containing protein n=1 Tax=Frondihabitans sucicola TaxID=1268041 RepID=A0ABM8GRY4_9MICO|nr:hypothetical protein GCM10025867_34650 [Frondihabitans sucicola]